MHQHDSFTNAFLNNLAKNVRANSPTFGIKGLESRTSLDIKYLLSKERVQTDPSPRVRSPTVFQLNMQTPPAQNVIQINLHSNEGKKHKNMKSPPPPPSRQEYGLAKGDRSNSHSNSEKDILKSRKEIPVHTENLKSPTLTGEAKRQSLLRKMVGLDSEKKESSTRSNQFPSPNDRVKEMLQKHSEGNTIILETQREQLRESYREMDSYQRRMLEQEDLDRSGLEKENMDLKERIRKLTMENQNKEERCRVLEARHREDVEKYRRENEEMMDKLRDMEQKLSLEMIDLIADKNRYEAERLEYIDHIAEFDEKRAKLISENFKLKEEIALQEMAQENMKRTTETFKQKSRSQMATDKKLRETLKSTLGDLAQLTEKAMQIELDHSRTVKELESKLVGKDGEIAGLEDKYKEEIEQMNKEIQELKKKNNRLMIEKEGLSMSLIKQKDGVGKPKCASLKNLVPNIDINLENTEENQEKSEGQDSGRSLRDRGNSVLIVERLMKEKDDLRNSVRNLEAEVNVYRDKITELYHENEKLKRDVSKEQAKVQEYTDNLRRQLEGLQGKDTRSSSVSKENVRRPLEEARLNINGRRHTEKGHAIHSRISLTEPDQPYMLTPREREDLSSVKTPPLKDNFRVVMNDMETNKKGGMYKDENECLNSQRTMRPERLYIEDDHSTGGIRDGISRMNTQSLTDMKTVKNMVDIQGRKSKENLVITSLDGNTSFGGQAAQKPKRSQNGKSLNLLNMRSGENRPIGLINL